MRKLAPVLALAVVVVLVAAGGHHRAAPTYYRDVAPILNEKCTGCHHLGAVAPFALTNAADAKAHAAGIAELTKAGLMPPWMPGPDSAQFVGQEQRRLTADEIDTIARWAAAGAPTGAAADAHSTPSTGAGLTGPGTTLTLAPPRTYMPHATGGAIDDYHCFLLDPKLTSDQFVTGALIKPQQAGIVHHVILFEAVGAQVAAAEQLNRANGGKGWTCFGGPNLPPDLSGPDAFLRLGSPEWVAAWVPGHVTNSLPDGLGVPLQKGARIVMQVHYNLIRAAHPDRSQVVLELQPATTPLTPLHTMLVAAPVELPCPNGVTGRLCSRQRALADETTRYGAEAAAMPTALLALCHKTLTDYPRQVGAGTSIGTSCDRAVREPMTIFGVGGHMHLRGRDISLVLDPGTANQQTLLHIPHWDFHWQDVYYLKTPVHVGPGDTLRLSCSYDNSAGAQPVIGTKQLAPRYVLWGEGTTDEMCLSVLAVTLP